MSTAKQRVRAVARNVVERGDATLNRVTSHLGVTRRLYPAFGRKFDSELEALAAGRIAFERNAADGNAAYRLRRNVHRLEKGLAHHDRRAQFALDYIDLTVADFDDAVDRGTDRSATEWARAVLTQYFDVVRPADERTATQLGTLEKAFRSSCDRLDAHRAASDEPSRAATALEGVYAPYRHEDHRARALGIDALRTLAVQRRSVRTFDGNPVPDGVLRAAVQVASEAPSACNRLPYRYEFSTDPDRNTALLKLPIGAGNFSAVPVVGVLIGDFSAYSSPRDRHVPYIDGGLTMMLFTLAIEAQGLSSCVINWPELRRRELAARTLLGLPAHERPICFVAIGHASCDAVVPASVKKHVDQLHRVITAGDA
ncbi:MAG: nitroreductase family protein [Ilumatobacteraceae bacterium]